VEAFSFKHVPHTNGALRPYEPALMTLLRIFDALLGVVCFIGLNVYFNISPLHLWEVSLLIFCMAMISFHEAGIYRSWRFSSLQHEFSQIFWGCFVLYAFLVLVGYLLKVADEFPRHVVIGWMIIWPVGMSMGRTLIRSILRHYRKQGLNVRRAVIAGAGKMGRRLSTVINTNAWSGTQLLGFFDDSIDHPVDGFPVLGNLAALPEFVRQNDLDIVYLALPLRLESKIQGLLRDLSDSTVSVHLIPDILCLDLFSGGSLNYFDNLPVIELRDTPLRGINALFKRMEDLILASCILMITSPLLCAISLIIKCTSRGPVFFKQWRYGLNGKPIVIYKFRTMTVLEDGYEFTQASPNDDRVTPFGMLLRRTSLDELPQLFNVLQGTMSLVGPRPHPVAMNEEYRKRVYGYMLRHKVKPGITGLAQINGCRGETDTLDKMKNRVRFDLEYLQQWSLVLDLKIIITTLCNGAWKRNAY